VYIDVHKAIRRIAPAPKAVHRSHIVGNLENGIHHCSDNHLIDLREGTNSPQKPEIRKNSSAILGSSPKTTFIRRASAGAADGETVQVRGNMNDMREHLKHLGPSNLASRPKTTRYQTVKIKPGLSTRLSDSRAISATYSDLVVDGAYHDLPASGGGEGEGLLKSAGKDASDGVHALQQGYGATDHFAPSNSIPAPGDLKKDSSAPNPPSSYKNQSSNQEITIMSTASNLSTLQSEHSSDSLGSMQARNTKPRKRGTARSGSITENIVEANGIRKVVLETTSNSDDELNERLLKDQDSSKDSIVANHTEKDTQEETPKSEEVKKKRRRTRKKKGSKAGEGSTASGSVHGDI